MTREEARAHISATLGQSETTEFLLDYLEDCWETVDLLTETFGSEQARALLLAQACFDVLAVFPGQADDWTNQWGDPRRLPGGGKEPEQPPCNGSIGFQ